MARRPDNIVDIFLPDVNAKTLSQLLKISLARWPGNCSWIAEECLKLAKVSSPKDVLGFLKDAKRIYGHYRGPVDEGSIFSARMWSHHSWLAFEFGGKALVFDPTRWAFDRPKEPYLYVGYTNEEEYDAEALGVRKQFRRPPPVFDPTARIILDLPKGPSERHFREAILNIWNLDLYQVQGGKITMEQLHYLGTHAPSELGEHCVPIYKWIVHKGHRGLIPIDYMEVLVVQE